MEISQENERTGEKRGNSFGRTDSRKFRKVIPNSEGGSGKNGG